MALEAQVASRVSMAGGLRKLAVAHTGLGHPDEALFLARRAVEKSSGPLVLSFSRLDLALVQVLVGKEDAAVATHPVFSRLEDHLRFRELERRFGG